MVWLREGGNWPESVLLLYFSRQWDHRPNGAVFWRWRRRCWMRHCVDCGWVVQTFLRKKKFPHWSAACRSWSHTAGCDRSIAVIVVRHLISWFWVFFSRFSILFGGRIRSLQNYVRRLVNLFHRCGWYHRRGLLFGEIIAQAGNLSGNKDTT